MGKSYAVLTTTVHIMMARQNKGSQCIKDWIDTINDWGTEMESSTLFKDQNCIV